MRERLALLEHLRVRVLGLRVQLLPRRPRPRARGSPGACGRRAHLEDSLERHEVLLRLLVLTVVAQRDLRQRNSAPFEVAHVSLTGLVAHRIVQLEEVVRLHLDRLFVRAARVVEVLQPC